MSVNYLSFRICSLDVYKLFNENNASLIERLCASHIFPSGIIITGKIGVGKSTFADVITNHFYNDNNLHKNLVIFVDTPVDNSAQYCREILQRAIRIKQVFRKRVFIVLDEAHMLSFAAQQVFLYSLEREDNITIIFITNDTNKICDALQNRCLLIDILPFTNKKSINEFAKFIYSKINCLDKNIENNYNRVISSSVFSISGRDIINAIIYGDFSNFDNINIDNKKLKLQDISNYVEEKINKNEKINFDNILEIISNILLSDNCTCINNKECNACKKLNIFLKLHSFVNNTRSLRVFIKLLCF